MNGEMIVCLRVCFEKVLDYDDFGFAKQIYTGRYMETVEKTFTETYLNIRKKKKARISFTSWR